MRRIGPVVDRVVEAEAAIDVLHDRRPPTFSAVALDVSDQRDVHVLLRRRCEQVPTSCLHPDLVAGARVSVAEDQERGVNDVAGLVAPVSLVLRRGGALAEASQAFGIERAPRELVQDIRQVMGVAGHRLHADAGEALMRELGGERCEEIAFGEAVRRVSCGDLAVAQRVEFGPVERRRHRKIGLAGERVGEAAVHAGRVRLDRDLDARRGALLRAASRGHEQLRMLGDRGSRTLFSHMRTGSYGGASANGM